MEVDARHDASAGSDWLRTMRILWLSCVGPLVLFALEKDVPATGAAKRLLAAKAVRAGVWSVDGASRERWR